ncbi:MAG: 1,4-dihydroxy-2-naphthoate polyprenyltransferase [Deltaproteobacteria bacterium]|nr:1,4-dihydroxy-2-naphthoate polyprenyltransferase [Deltaproteobacteria bacterium]
MPSLAVWISAARPRTLPAAVVPVLVGLAVARRAGPLDWGLAALTLVAALLIQIGTNLANDYYDFLSGADGADRLGPPRATQQALASPRAMRSAAALALAGAALAGACLVRAGGLPILIVGVLSLGSAVAYTGGPFPLAYHGLGDLFVFVFFGLVAVCGTVYLQTRGLSALAFAAAVPVACLVTAILVVNNLRDIASDARAGKRTLAVRLGARATRLEFVLLTGLAFALVPAIAAGAGAKVLLAWLVAPLAVREARALYARDGAALNRSLAATARLHLAFGALFAAGLWP